MACLSGKVALITGSSSGVGRAIALAFAAQDTKFLVCADIQPHGRAEIPEEAQRATHDLILESRGVNSAVFVRTDATDPTEVEACVAEAVKKGGRLDILVNVVGGGHMGTRLHETSLEAWEASMCVFFPDPIRDAMLFGLLSPDILDRALNLRSTFLFCKASLAQFLVQPLESEDEQKQRGVIVNLSSIFGLVGHQEGGAYNTVKAGIVNLTRNIALDYAQDRIRCNAICPGFIRTALTQQWMDDADIGASMRGSVPLWRNTGKDDVARAAVFLASEADAGWITGVALPVDGGFTAR